MLGCLKAALSALVGLVSANLHAQSNWLPVHHRYKPVYDAQAIGNRGLQYQSVVVWNEGTNDPDKRGWIVTGQDENGVRLSTDYGATWTNPRLAGMFCSRMAGLYLNTDDDIFVAVGDAFGNTLAIGGYTGLYVGDSSLLSAKRVEGLVHPDNSRAFIQVMNGAQAGRNINCIARRPQTGGLTHAERPIIVIEQERTDLVADPISRIFVWLSPDNGATWNMVRELPVADYATGADGIFQVAVAPNGDVLLMGQKGAFRSNGTAENPFASAPTKVYPASGDQVVSSGYFFGGSPTTSSGARIGIYQTNPGGVFETADIRNPSFAKPNGNAGLPANYRVWYLGASPLNPDRIGVVTTGNPLVANAGPFLSTDGGANFSPVADLNGSGDEERRYEVRVTGGRGHAGFYFCPTDELKCLTPTSQTMSRSIDGGVTTNGDLVVGFDGMHSKGVVGLDPVSPLKQVRMTQDSGANVSLDGMHWVRPTQILSNTPYGVDGYATVGAAILAAGGGSSGGWSGAGAIFGTAPGKNRIVAFHRIGAGAGQPNIPVVLDDPDGDGDYREDPTNNIRVKVYSPTKPSRAVYGQPSPKDANAAFVGRWLIENLDADTAAGVTFTDRFQGTSPREFIGCFLDGTTLVSYWGDFRNGGGNNDKGTAFYRSTSDRAETGLDTAWYTLPGGNLYLSGAVCPDPFSVERVLYVRRNNMHQIREVKRVGTELVDTVLVNLYSMPGGLEETVRAEVGDPALTVPTMPIEQVMADPNKAGVFYAIIGRHGVPNWWRSVDNGVTWINITDNAPRTSWTGIIHPLTGEVLGFSSMGEHLLRSPTGIEYPDLPNKDALSDQVVAYKSLHPIISTTTLPGGYVGAPYSQTLVAGGGDGAHVWSLASGSLPAGLSLSPDGVISGTPTAAANGTFDVRVADSDDVTGFLDEDIQTLSIVISANSVPIITTASLPNGGVGTPYNQTLAATGGDGAQVWSIAAGSLPAGLSLSSAGEITGTPIAAGSVSFTVRVADSDAITDAFDSDEQVIVLNIEKAVATLSLNDLNQVYDGTPRPVTVTTAPAGLMVDVTYDDSATAPINAGSYLVTATASDANYLGTATGTLVIAKAPAAVMLGSLSQIYDGSAKSVTVSTDPAGLATSVLYNGSTAAPTNAGSYAVQATVQETNFAGSAAGTLTIAKAAAAITLNNLVQRYDGTPRVVIATTVPANLPVTMSYDGDAAAPVLPGSYAIVGTILETNYAGTASGTLQVGTTALVRHAPTLNAGLDGSLQLLSGENTTLNGNAWVSGDLLVPGTPNVRLNGSPHYGGTVDDLGATTPTGYTITLNGNAVLRQVVRRVDPIQMPTVATPPLPTGTVNVVLNSPGQSVSNWTTLRNLTLNGSAGFRSIPPGTYGNFSANGSSGFVFGIAGATEPAVYNLQSLTLNTQPGGGSSPLQVVGPVIITLANGAVINGTSGSSSHPEWLTLRFASGGLTLNGNVSFSGDVIAPNGTVTLNGNSELNGTVTADRLTLNGTSMLAEPDAN